MTLHSAKSRLRGMFRSIFGGYRDYTVNLTASASTTDQMDIRGLAFGRIYNETGGSITITFYSAKWKGATPRRLRDEDGVADSFTISDGDSQQLPSQIASASLLAVVLSSGTASNVTFHFER